MHRSRFRFLALAVGASMLLWGGIAATPASAAPVTFLFTGTVGDVGGAGSNVSPPFAIGQTFQGSYTFESTTPNNGGSPINGIYTGALTGMSLTFNPGSFYSTTGISAPPNEIRVTNSNSGDSYHLESGVTGPDVNGHAVQSFFFTLDGPNSIFANNALQTLPPSVAAFTDGNT